MAERLIFPNRGEIWLVSFDPAQGAEIRKTRPALILQNDIGNRTSPLTIVAAVSSNVPSHPFPVQTKVAPPEGGMKLFSVVQLNHLRTIDKTRLIRRLGQLKPQTMTAVERSLSISLGLVDLE